MIKEIKNFKILRDDILKDFDISISFTDIDKKYKNCNNKFPINHIILNDKKYVHKKCMKFFAPDKEDLYDWYNLVLTDFHTEYEIVNSFLINNDLTFEEYFLKETDIDLWLESYVLLGNCPTFIYESENFLVFEVINLTEFMSLSIDNISKDILIQIKNMFSCIYNPLVQDMHTNIYVQENNIKYIDIKFLKFNPLFRYGVILENFEDDNSYNFYPFYYIDEEVTLVIQSLLKILEKDKNLKLKVIYL